jgi:hypothetical protein
MGVHMVGRVGGLDNGTGRQICQYTVLAEPPVTEAPKTWVPPFKTDSGEVGDEFALVKEEPAAETVTPIEVEFPPQLETTAARNTTAISPNHLIQFPPKLPSPKVERTRGNTREPSSAALSEMCGLKMSGSP